MLVNKMCLLRKFDYLNSVVLVVIDGGQGSLKIIMNVFDPSASDFQPRNHNNTGVNCVIILGIFTTPPPNSAKVYLGL